MAGGKKAPVAGQGALPAHLKGHCNVIDYGLDTVRDFSGWMSGKAKPRSIGARMGPPPHWEFGEIGDLGVGRAGDGMHELDESGHVILGARKGSSASCRELARRQCGTLVGAGRR